MKLIKNVLMFERRPDTKYLMPSNFQIRAGAEIQVVFGTEEVRMPNGALCEKRVACFQTADGMDYYLLVEEMGETESVVLTGTH